jgi:hypothetical protein
MKIFYDPQKRTLYSIIFLLLFGIMMTLPLWQEGLSIKSIDSDFRGKIALSGYFNQARMMLGDKFFGSAIVGKQGWMYFVGGNGNATFWHVDEAEKKKIDLVVNDIGNFNQELLSRKIRLVIVIVPDKSSIYPQFLPDEIQLGEHNSYTDMFVQSLKDRDVNVIDLRVPLMEASKEEQVFYKTDSHWNIYGDYAAYKAVIEELSVYEPGLAPVPFSDLRLISNGYLARDIPVLLRTNNIVEESFLLQPKKNKTIKEEVIPLGTDRTMTFTRSADEQLPSALVYHDSAFAYVASLLHQNFSHTVSIFYPVGLPEIWNSGWVEQVAPDFVIIEFTERLLPITQWPIYAP